MTVQIVQAGEAAHAAQKLQLPEQVQLSMASIADAAKDGLMALSVAAGLAVIDAIVAEEVTAVCGPKGKHDSDRKATRHGTEPTTLTVGGQRVRTEKPRVRSTTGDGEVTLKSWQHLTDGDPMGRVVAERLLAGVSCRRYAACAEPLGEAVQVTSTTKSSINRTFVERTKQALNELVTRPLAEHRFCAIMIDGIELADECCVTALGITYEGRKVPLGLWHGSTENATICRHLLSDIVERGFSAPDGLLVVIDGGKGIAKAVREVFGSSAIVQRCQLHKERNVLDHLPDTHRDWVRTRLMNAWTDTDHDRALGKLRRLAAELERTHPDAAASLREGMTDTLTVTKLGLVGTTLWKTLHTTNPIESMMDVVRTRSRNVKRWRAGDMRKRWTAAGMLDAERSFRRVRGYRDIPKLVLALKRQLHPVDATTQEAQAA